MMSIGGLLSRKGGSGGSDDQQQMDEMKEKRPFYWPNDGLTEAQF
ncbi:MAG: hypothetical protein WAK17_02295 [Candidatus Nitrosopolaris sp.]|jgi:hypothetical protein